MHYEPKLYFFEHCTWYVVFRTASELGVWRFSSITIISSIWFQHHDTSQCVASSILKMTAQVFLHVATLSSFLWKPRIKTALHRCVGAQASFIAQIDRLNAMWHLLRVDWGVEIHKYVKICFTHSFWEKTAWAKIIVLKYILYVKSYFFK